MIREARPTTATAEGRTLRVLPALFLLSGASSLIFETVFTRLLTYTFGNTAYAVSSVLACFLAGLALGAVTIGKWIDRRPASLRVYGFLELLIGSFCLAVPILFGVLTHAYVRIYHWLQPGTVGLTGLRVALAGSVILIPTFLMGGTFPVAARYIAALRSNFESDVNHIYASNTLGGALGVLVSTYILIPTFGVRGTIATAFAINLTIFLVVEVMERISLEEPVRPGYSISGAPTVPATEADGGDSRTWMLLFGALLTGTISLSYEVVWTHALSFLIGNTVYAFGVMLFTFLCGLGLGARIVARRLNHPSQWAYGLAASQFLLGLVVAATLPMWIHVPAIFASGVSAAYNYDLWILAVTVMARITYVFWRNRRQSGPRWRVYEAHITGIAFFVLVVLVMPGLQERDATYFAAGELLRLFCVFGLLIAPAILVGVSFPLLLSLYGRHSPKVGTTVGNIYALNTIGTVLGSLLTGFVILPRLGSLVTLRGCAAVNILLGAAFTFWLVPMTVARRRAFSVGAALIAVAVVVVPGQWDMSRITGTYAYFSPGWHGQHVLFAKEDVQGGLTSVVQTGTLRTLLSNGKFQGDNSGEMGTQVRFAMIPALFTRQFDQALVIGLGTGHTLRTVARLPFHQIDAAELAPQLVQAAREWFADVNDLVFIRDPRVKLSVADGRNFLLLSRKRYDMITLEITSLWISGQADLYNKEFYELCRAHLQEHGVLQQWVALHHLRTKDLLVILNTAAQVFPHAAFFQSGAHGFLLASSSPLEIDYQQVTSLDQDLGVSHELKSIGLPSAWVLLSELVLYDNSFRKTVGSLHTTTGLPEDFASTDFRPYLEYQVPKGITLTYDTVERNTAFLQAFASPPPPSELRIRNLPSEDEHNLVLGYVAEGRGDIREARSHFGRVAGPARARAQLELSRLDAAKPIGSSTSD